MPNDSLRNDALRIWQAGVDAVRADSLITRNLSIRGNILRVEDHEYDLRKIDRLIVLGGGKASGAMANGFEQLWHDQGIARIQLLGWVNVPRGSFEESRWEGPGRRIHLHAAREPGLNEPTADGVFGCDRMLQLAKQATSRDLVLCLLSGGASALMPAPVPGLTLEEKLAVTRHLSHRGANIEELNEVRRCLSRIKGGGLARACAGAQRVITLIISDVLGDPLSMIGSGPTILDPPPNPKRALELLDQFDPMHQLPPAVRQVIMSPPPPETTHWSPCPVDTFVLANNATAVDAAGTKAVELGYAYWMESSPRSEGDVAEVSKRLFDAWRLAYQESAVNCIISGGEPTVKLPTDRPVGKGGRNQQLALSVLQHCLQSSDQEVASMLHMAAVFGGTDGEDGPTTAAGAIVDSDVISHANHQLLDPARYLQFCDAFSFFEKTQGLLVTGPTHTNVCDLRVLLVDPVLVDPRYQK